MNNAEHPIKVWLARQTPPKTMKAFAEDCEVEPITLRRLINGESASTRLFQTIEIASGGELSAAALAALFQSQQSAAIDALEAHLRPQRAATA